jgi:ABC-2 type transport system permease protein
MPIKPEHIVLSRVFTLLIYNYLECALVMAPCIVCYAVLGGSPLGVIGGIIVLLLLPLLALTLSSAFGYLVAILSKKFKRNTLFTTVISLAFIVLYFVFYSWLMESGAEDMTPEAMEALASKLGAVGAIGSVATLHPIYTPVFVLISAGIALGAYIIISRSYVSIITSSGKVKKNKYRAERLEKRSAVYAFTKKELSRFFSSSTYILNSSMGMIFAVMLSVVALFNGGELIVLAEMLSLEGIDGFGALYALGATLLSLLGSMTYISASSVSLEGKSLWIPRTMPISGREVLLSKTLAHIIISAIPTLVSSVLFIIALGVAPEYMAFYILSPLLTSALSAVFGAVINTAFPKFEFKNEAEPIKQSLSTFLVMMALLLFEMLIAIGTFVMSVFGLALLAAILGLALRLVTLAALSFVMCTASARKFERFAS